MTMASGAASSGRSARPSEASARSRAASARAGRRRRVSRAAAASSSPRRRARTSSVAVMNTLTGASGNTTVPMSRPSTTPPAVLGHPRALPVDEDRAHRGVRRHRRHHAGDLGPADGLVHVAAVEAAPHRRRARCRRRAPRRPPRRPSSRSTPASIAASVTARYMAPVSRVWRPSAAATPVATVDLPDPAGPSMATTEHAHQRRAAR